MSEAQDPFTAPFGSLFGDRMTIATLEPGQGYH
jgi:hypothetical protein